MLTIIMQHPNSKHFTIPEEGHKTLHLLGNDLAMLFVLTTEIMNRAKKIEFV